MRRDRKNILVSQAGFTIVELLVSMGMLSVIGLVVTGYMTTTFRRVGIETRTAVLSQELKNAMTLISNEFRMGSIVSPYLPGFNADTVTCLDAVEITDNTAKFLVVHDDSTVSNGMQIYYVGYSFDASEGKLYRGEIASALTSDCTAPAGDPTSSSVAQLLLENVVRIDSDNDGNLEPVFSLTNSILTVNMGVEASAQDDLSKTQGITTQVYSRKELS